MGLARATMRSSCVAPMTTPVATPNPPRDAPCPWRCARPPGPAVRRPRRGPANSSSASTRWPCWPRATARLFSAAGCDGSCSSASRAHRSAPTQSLDAIDCARTLDEPQRRGGIELDRSIDRLGRFPMQAAGRARHREREVPVRAPRSQSDGRPSMLHRVDPSLRFEVEDGSDPVCPLVGGVQGELTGRGLHGSPAVRIPESQREVTEDEGVVRIGGERLSRQRDDLAAAPEIRQRLEAFVKSSSLVGAHASRWPRAGGRVAPAGLTGSLTRVENAS